MPKENWLAALVLATVTVTVELTQIPYVTIVSSNNQIKILFVSISTDINHFIILDR
jgi:hypothetical protein